MFYRQSKHIHKRYCFIRECVERYQIDVEHILGKEQLADVLTKALAMIQSQGNEGSNSCTRSS